MHKGCFRPLWDEPFVGPLTYSAGFRASFQPLVEALFALPFAKASKLIARANLDWLGNPESKDVAEDFMFKGSPSTLRLIADCSPEVIFPMDWKAFRVLKEVMRTAVLKGGKKAAYKIEDCSMKGFSVNISEDGRRRHRGLHAFKVTSTIGEHIMLIIKLPQHPARMFRPDYGARCGEALRKAALHLAATNTGDAQPA